MKLLLPVFAALALLCTAQAVTTVWISPAVADTSSQSASLNAIVNQIFRRPLLDKNAHCVSSQHCRSPLFCDPFSQFTCQLRRNRTLGDVCTDSYDCAGSLYCHEANGICIERKLYGEVCWTSRECRSDLVCRGICESVVSEEHIRHVVGNLVVAALMGLSFVLLLATLLTYAGSRLTQRLVVRRAMQSASSLPPMYHDVVVDMEQAPPKYAMVAQHDHQSDDDDEEAGPSQQQPHSIK
jgi:hypothetical protein